jgi:predicted N-acetyltransferase YhbS
MAFCCRSVRCFAAASAALAPGLPCRLTDSSVSSMEALIRAPDVGWQQTEADLRVLVSGNAGGVNALGIHDEATGELLSMAALSTFDGPNREAAWGWLAYVVTTARARRLRLARTLVEALLRDAPPCAIGLYGSTAGVPLYSALGFVGCGTAQLMQRLPGPAELAGSATLPSGMEITPARAALGTICALDAQIYGADRGALLAGWADSEASWVLREGGQLVGYVLARPAHPAGAVWLGPLVAPSVEAAEAMLRTALAALPDEATVQMLLPDVALADGLAAPVERLGFERVGDATRLMVRPGGGEACVPWTRCWGTAEARSGAPRPFAATGYEFG